MNARFRERLARLHTFAGQPIEALADARLAVQLDPFSPSANAEVARALLANNRCDEALAQLDKLRSLRPALLRAGNIAAQCYAHKGMWPEAIAETQRASANGGTVAQALLGYMLARAGRTDEARRILAALLDRSRRLDGSAFNVGVVYAGLGENDQAFQWLDKATEARSFFLEDAHLILDALEPDPRVDRLRRRLGIQNR